MYSTTSTVQERNIQGRHGGDDIIEGNEEDDKILGNAQMMMYSRAVLVTTRSMEKGGAAF
jgi:hypothetical protein